MITVRDLIRRLGGPTVVAAKCGVSPAAVTNWQAREQIASRHVVTVWRHARECGVEWTPPGADGLTLSPQEAA